MMAPALFLAISFLASVIGAICGIGGGILIKPALDVFNLASISTTSFLSNSTVLAMAGYSVAKSLWTREKRINTSIILILAAGGSVGGVAGQKLFQIIRAAFPNADRVGAVQAACLTIITFGTFVYVLNKRRINSHRISNRAACLAVGSALGILSSFLGIGGGPINHVVLYYFFSLDAKSAARTSLFIILCSQISNILYTVTSRSVPVFDPLILIIMITGGLLGGIVGRTIYKRMDNRAVERLFIVLMVTIIGISVCNVARYAGLISQH